MGKSRRAIPLSVRFEVFKRDSFMCRYCGRRPPEIELVIEHVIAVANGGTNDPANLLASCGACNLGKNVKPIEIGALPPVSDEALARMEADLERLRRMASMQAEMQKILDAQWWKFVEEWVACFHGQITRDDDGTLRAKCDVSFPHETSIRSRLRDGVSLSVMFDAMAISARAHYRRGASVRKHEVAPYFFAVLRNMVNGVDATGEPVDGGGGC